MQGTGARLASPTWFSPTEPTVSGARMPPNQLFTYRNQVLGPPRRPRLAPHLCAASPLLDVPTPSPPLKSRRAPPPQTHPKAAQPPPHPILAPPPPVPHPHSHQQPAPLRDTSRPLRHPAPLLVAGGHASARARSESPPPGSEPASWFRGDSAAGPHRARLPAPPLPGCRGLRGGSAPAARESWGPPSSRACLELPGRRGLVPVEAHASARLREEGGRV